MKKITLLLAGLIAVQVLAAQTVVAPKIKSSTTFAIVVDAKSYAKTQQAIELYRDAVEKDGLGAYIIHSDWKSPDEVRAVLQKLHGDKKAPLEGAVFVGDIPIPMLRDAQHLTSAFKMDQRRNWQQSSVPSDRYYDDFGLKFDFLKQDSLKPLYFYYTLRADSEQHLSSDIYTARMRPLEQGKEDKYVQLDKYLRKVVVERTKNSNNRLDVMSMARGHGYNSESKVAWSGEQVALREQFPDMFMTGGKIKFMDFESRFPAKGYYINEVLRPELDVMLFHHHGSNDTQYLNGYKPGTDPNTAIENVKLYLRSKVFTAASRGKKTREQAIEEYCKAFDVPRSWCEGAFDPKLIEADSLFNTTLDIYVSDILGITPNARFVMFDACFNGSFYEDEYIAGAYIFNDGKTIVTQANTVNTIQDKWPDEFLGLLAGGLRVGQWNRKVQFLETHTIGDPTYRFANTALDFDINQAIALHDGDVKFWLPKTKHQSVDVQCLALAMLYKGGYKDISGMLKKTFTESGSGVVRLEAMRLLAKIDNQDFIDVLKLAVADSYELVRRFAAEYIARNGSDELIPAYAWAMLNDMTSERVSSKLGSMAKMLDPDKLSAELKKQEASMVLYKGDEIDSMIKALERGKKSDTDDMALVMDRTSSAKDKLFEIRNYRNFPIARYADNLLAFAADNTRDQELRLCVIEALGWYTFSYRRNDVVAGLRKIADADNPAVITNEAIKSINRLTRP